MNQIMITVRRVLLLLLSASVCVSIAAAQDDSGSNDTGAVPAATAPAEQNNAENPPLSGLDQPVAEPAFGGRSYLVPGLQVSESVDSNATGASGSNNHMAEITRALGSVDMQKIWRRYQFGLDYIAGGDFYAGPIILPGQGRATQSHTLAADQRILWRTGQLVIRDSFDYLPEGTFGFSSYGGAGSFGSALGGISGSGAGAGLGGGISGGSPAGLFGGGQYGSLGFQPRVGNDTIIDITQGLSPRSTVTLAGGYDFTDYLNVNNSTAPFKIINSQQITGQIGFNHLLTRKDQVGIDYAFQEFHFPRAGSGSVNAHVWNVLYGHRITGRLNLTVAGGPQLVILHNPPTTTNPSPTTSQLVSANGSLTLAYTVSSRTSASVMYQRYVTPGSGFFAGANTNAARLTLGHLFGRHWTTNTDVGYSHNSNLQTSSTTSGAGINTRTYQFWYAGTSLQRQLGQQFSAFVSYQFNDMGVGQCTGPGTGVCGLSSMRHTGQIGINWHPRPIRLD
ncbi:MAG TPA: hypothetical protein VFM77_14655 [Terriglobales bacterium]|nr:hypothetical protein [Terriglobales bacterium]